MDQNEDQKLQNIEKYSKSHFFRWTWQLIVSLSLFSLLLCYYSFGFSLFPYSINVYLSTFLLSFFSYTPERKYMFLICNGILAFLAKTSVSCSSSTDMRPVSVQNAAPVEEEEEEEEEEDIWSLYGEENERGCDNEGREEEESVPLTKQEEELEEVEPEVANEELAISTDELNKKFEDFIRKMKEEIRIEAQRPLISV
ncbi:hypothetical protein CFOL_v3_03390 [Cephalotus follicularis]|uniref:Uncharacterized protein n=1 Tax=Cephalotus follicularis TaxID=3775 RepID=A0A1Q3AVV7_CEPFO|nr:hypothetical protein CFOL_v3_03390 [Cephalotus follicularis]